MIIHNLYYIIIIIYQLKHIQVIIIFWYPYNFPYVPCFAINEPTKFYNIYLSFYTFFPAYIAAFTIIYGFYHIPEEPIIILDISSLLKAKVDG